jgi:hypothetical protein
MGRQARKINADWDTKDNHSYEAVQLEVLMDIRSQLQRLNNLLHCHNFVDIPKKLERIARHTVKPKRRKLT